MKLHIDSFTLSLCELRDLAPNAEFYRIRGGYTSANRYTKLGYNRANKAMGWAATFTCGRDDDIGYSVELKPGTMVLPADRYEEIVDLTLDRLAAMN